VTGPPRSPRLLVLLASVLVLLVACDAGSTAATIGGTELTHERLEGEVAMFRFLAGLSGAPCGTPVEGESEESACVRFALTNVIQEEVVSSYADGRDVAVDDAEVQDAIAQLEQNLGGPAELDARLEADGVTRGQLEALASDGRLVEAIRPVADLLTLPRLDVSELEADRFRHGSAVHLTAPSNDGRTAVFVTGSLLGIGTVRLGWLQPDKVISLREDDRP